MIKCPGCGGEMQYSPTDKKVKCEYCGNVYDVKELLDDLKKAQEEKVSENSYEGKSYHCTQCGATLLTFDDTAITFCSYCGSQAMLEDKMIRQNNPDVVIPFKLNKEEAISAYRKKVSKFLFAPKYMESKMVVEKFRGIYMPYGIYNLFHHGPANSVGKRYAYRRGDYAYYDDYLITTDVDASYEGISFDLSSKFYDNFSTAIPFDYKEAEPFNPAYLTGYYADCLDVKNSVYSYEATKMALPDTTRRLRRKHEYVRYGCTNPTLSLKCDKKTGMFPVYFLAIRNQEDNAVHYAVVNGQTGKVAIELPIDFKKYIILSLIIAMFVFVGLNAFFTIKPTGVLGFSLVASIVSCLLSKIQLQKIERKKLHMDDKGFQSVEKVAKKDIIKTPFTLLNVVKNLFFSGLIAVFGIGFFIDALEFDDMTLSTVGIVFGVFFLGSFLILNRKTLKDNKRTRDINLKRYGEEAVLEAEAQTKEERGEQNKFLLKEILAMIISFIVLISGTVEDTYFYIATIVSLVLVVLSFGDLVKEHNILVSNKLPQLEKRGGDENE